MVQERPKVAIVEDDTSLLKAVGRLLVANGYDVDLFSSAEAYLSRFEQSAAEYLVLDIDLYGMSGLELQRCLVGAGKAPPIIFMTGQDDTPSIGKAIDKGCIAYLHKPFESHALLNALKAAAGEA